MTERDGTIRPISSVPGPTPARPVGPSVEGEQPELFERMLEQGRGFGESAAPAEGHGVELVATLTRDEVHRVEDHLPDGMSVARILGRALEYHPTTEPRRGGHPPPGEGHVDAQA